LKNLLGELPEPPDHEFVGRSRELLKLERLLEHEKWAAVVGQGGEGKTTLAVELARWLVRSKRFGRAVFVSAEKCLNVRTMTDSVGRQLIPKYSVSQFPGAELFGKAFQPIERALGDSDTIIVLDNMETVQKSVFSEKPDFFSEDCFSEFLNLFTRLLSVGNTRLIFTSREPMPEPFDREKQTVSLHRLDKDSAVDLVTHVMAREGLELKEDDECNTAPEIES
ncbi:MAG: ATP-binding protein, partial [bacterium]|nr:ATP-binding protein [bacterium]